MIEASKRPEYFNPLVSKSNNPVGARLLSSLLPARQKCRTVVHALSCRAMKHMAEGDADAAWQDLLACQRLGRLLLRNGTTIEALAGIALVIKATDGQLTVLGHGTHSPALLAKWTADVRNLKPISPVAEKFDVAERTTMLDCFMSVAYRGPKVVDEIGTKAGESARRDWTDRLFTASIDWDLSLKKANRIFDACVAAGRLPRGAARQTAIAAIDDEVKDMKRGAKDLSFLERSLLSESERGELIGNIVIALLLPAVEKLCNAFDRVQQIDVNLNTALALARYRAAQGRNPPRLSDLAPKYIPAVPMDVFAGQPLIYRPTENSYLLFSLGINGRDDDGHGPTDESRGDDLRVRMPAVKPVVKARAKADD